MGSNITVAEGETAGDIACAFCSVHIHGDVKGDVAVAFGKVEVDPGHSISGDVAVLGGDLTLGRRRTVGGDVSVAAGDATLGPGAMIHGSRTVLPGRIWLLLPFAPLILLIGLIWLASISSAATGTSFLLIRRAGGTQPPQLPEATARRLQGTGRLEVHVHYHVNRSAELVTIRGKIADTHVP